MVLRHIEDSAGKPLAEPTILLDQELGRGLKLQRKDEARDTGHIVGESERSHHFGQPVTIDRHIIIGIDKYLPPSRHHSSIARPGDAGVILADVAHMCYIAVVLPDEILRRARTGGIVHDNDLVLWVLHGQQ